MASLVSDPAPATWHDASREGAPPRGTDGELVYAIGDVHGCYDLLKALLACRAARTSSLLTP